MRKINLYEGRHIAKQLKNIKRKNDPIKKKFVSNFRFFLNLNEIIRHGTHSSYLAKNI